MSTRKTTRTDATGPRKTASPKTKSQAEPTKATPKTEPSKPQSSPEPEPKASKPYCDSCGGRIAPEETDPFLGSPLLYDDSGFANLSGALFLCGWRSQTLQKVVDGRPTVTLVGTFVDANGDTVPNKKIVTATWHHRTDIGWVQMAELCGYSRPDGRGFQNRTAEQLVGYVGNNVAEWVLAPIDEEAAEPKPKSKGKTTSSDDGKVTAKATAAPEPAPEPEAPEDSEASEPTVDPESRGLPQGSSPAPAEPDPAPAPQPEPEPEPEPVEPDPGDDAPSVEEDSAAAGVEEEVIEEGAAA